ncbi:MAG: FG-GAP-like repeat-containing protein [Candidatus Latescibacterota bacterium]|nr:FG-GAP-like repeat-containing protein [Candidatus Latescibacterota bacterium]
MRLGRLIIAFLSILSLGLSTGWTPAQQVETRRILAIRVSFPQETPDNETTSGDGKFDLRTFEEAVSEYRFPFDTPPHDRSYFAAHFQGLAHYFDTVSGGLLKIETDIFPSGEKDSYELNRPLIDYGNGRTRQEINARIVELFRDGVLAAEATGTLDFSVYDDVVVIHAGLGGESSNQLNDVPSAFVNQADLDTYIKGPIPVNRGSMSINKGILLPESGGTDGRSGLNGILARFYANQLGLPRLDNPEDDLPAVGNWSLMDTGNITSASSVQLGFDNLTGAVTDTFLIAYSPSLLTAWSRTRLGWLTPRVIRHDTTLSIAAAHSDTDHPKALRIPISASEYFLLENRMSRLAVEGRRPSITLTNGTRGVWVANDDYDAFIPGSGILIWHIDDDVISGFEDGKAVNSNPDFRTHFDGLVGLYRKGVALEEADGLEDIGNTSASRVITSGFISFASIQGSNQDPYYLGNVTRFAPDTTPNSNSNLGYNSGVEIEILSAPGETMEVTIRFGRTQGEWPRTLADPELSVSPRAIGLPGVTILTGGTSTGESALSLSGNNVLLDGFSSKFTPAIGRVSQGQTEEILFSDGSNPAMWKEGRLFTIADVGAVSTGIVSASPIISNFQGGPPTDAWGYTDGTVGWGVFGVSSGEANVGTRPIRAIAAGDVNGNGNNEWIAIDAAGSVFAIDGDRSSRQLGSVESPVGGPVVSDMNASGGDEVAVLSADGSVTIFSGTEIQTSRPVSGGAASSPILTDFDGDGFTEVLFGGDEKIWVTRFNGLGQSDTPYEIPLRDKAGRLEAPPLTADLDADGALDLVVASQAGVIYAISATGQTLPGFPILATGRILVSPLLADIDYDDNLELIAFTDQGTAHLWHLEHLNPNLTGTNVAWGQQGGNPANTGFFNQPGTPADDFGQGSLLPESSAYCYPNPIRGTEAFIRYYLASEAEVSLVIINGAGQIVYRVTATRSDALTDNEIRWDTSDYGNGIYICRLQATFGSRTETRFIKTAVIR